MVALQSSNDSGEERFGNATRALFVDADPEILQRSELSALGARGDRFMSAFHPWQGRPALPQQLSSGSRRRSADSTLCPGRYMRCLPSLPPALKMCDSEKGLTGIAPVPFGLGLPPSASIAAADCPSVWRGRSEASGCQLLCSIVTVITGRRCVGRERPLK
jgi:hypothetical protein